MHANHIRLLVLAVLISLGQLALAQTLQTPSWITLLTAPTQSPASVNTTGNVTTATVPRGQTAVAYFMPEGQQLRLTNQGDSLSIEFKLTFTSTTIGDASTGFRIGLFDSNLSTARPDGTSALDFKNFDGYAINWNPNPVANTPTNNSNLNNLRLRTKVPATSGGELLDSFSQANYSTTPPNVDRGTPEPVRTYFLPNTQYTATYTILKQSNGGLGFTLSISDGGTFSFGNNFTILSPTTDYFDTLAFYSVNTNGSDFNISGVTITAIPEPSTYAACAGAAVLGLAFWRRRRAAAKAAVA